MFHHTTLTYPEATRSAKWARDWLVTVGGVGKGRRERVGGSATSHFYWYESLLESQGPQSV